MKGSREGIAGGTGEGKQMGKGKGVEGLGGVEVSE